MAKARPATATVVHTTAQTTFCLLVRGCSTWRKADFQRLRARRAAARVGESGAVGPASASAAGATTASTARGGGWGAGPAANAAVMSGGVGEWAAPRGRASCVRRKLRAAAAR